MKKLVLVNKALAVLVAPAAQGSVGALIGGLTR
jgi:hypothetical protein